MDAMTRLVAVALRCARRDARDAMPKLATLLCAGFSKENGYVSTWKLRVCFEQATLLEATALRRVWRRAPMMTIRAR